MTFARVESCKLFNHIVLIAGRFKKGSPQGTIFGRVIFFFFNYVLQNILGPFSFWFCFGDIQFRNL